MPAAESLLGSLLLLLFGPTRRKKKKEICWAAAAAAAASRRPLLLPLSLFLLAALLPAMGGALTCRRQQESLDTIAKGTPYFVGSPMMSRVFWKGRIENRPIAIGILLF